MRIALLATLLLLPLAAAAQPVEQDMSAPGQRADDSRGENWAWIVGVWNLVKATQTENGVAKEYFGPQPHGQVMFSSDGRFGNILLRQDLPKFASNNRLRGTADENSAVVQGSVAFFGSYTLEDTKLTLHIDGSTFPNWTGAEQTREVQYDGDDTLTWSNAAGSGGGSVVLVFERAK